MSPKAIVTREHFGLVAGGLRLVTRQDDALALTGGEIRRGLGSGDYSV